MLGAGLFRFHLLNAAAPYFRNCLCQKLCITATVYFNSGRIQIGNCQCQYIEAIP